MDGNLMSKVVTVNDNTNDSMETTIMLQNEVQSSDGEHDIVFYETKIILFNDCDVTVFEKINPIFMKKIGHFYSGYSYPITERAYHIDWKEDGFELFYYTYKLGDSKIEIPYLKSKIKSE